MTISSIENRKSYTGNGVTTAFPFPYYFLSNADLVVIETVIATGVQTTKVLNTDYTVTGAANPAGGTVTAALVAPASTVTWTIYRDPTITQGVDLVNNDPFDADVEVEQPLDRLTMIAQRLSERITRSLRQPEGDSANISALPAKVTRASNYLAFDADGNPIAAAPSSGVITSAFMATVLDDADAAAARTTLDAAQKTVSMTAAAPAVGDLVGFADISNSNAERKATIGDIIILPNLQGTDVVSAATLNLDTATGEIVDVTGNTGITAVTLSQGRRRLVRFTGTPLITHGASLVLPGRRNIQIQAGDFVEFVGYASSVVRVANIRRANSILNLPLSEMTFRISNNSGDATNDIDFSAGQCRDSTGVIDIVTATGLTKQLDAAWAAGNNAGGRMSAAAIANTSYFAYAIIKDSDGSVDFGLDTSATAPTMPAGYTFFRRIGAILRAGGAILPFTQMNDNFRLNTAVRDINTQTPGTSGTAYTLGSVPAGIVVEVYGTGWTFRTSNASRASFYATGESSPGTSFGAADSTVVDSSAGGGNCGAIRLLTNTSRQISAVADNAATAIDFVTRGWIDTRGRFG